jgi:hypothetical protein
LGLASAVAGQQNEGRTAEADSASSAHEGPGKDLAEAIQGTWVSEVRETKWGPLIFEFHAGSDGRFELTGTPVDPSGDEVYRRSGPYRIEGHQLITPALNEGRPTQVRLQGGQLLLRIDAELEFLLRRK